ncbi:MAG: adenylate kinase [Candidatus Kapabacteria bacterium]|nr:adenylate kinase [Candidatus Kapabacteria bacterium]MDW8224809.1 adenylate kinase [Bacteroidota bacterium]
MVIVLFGAPGVGKGTQAQLLADRYGVPHLSTGEAFRRAIQENSEFGARARHYVERGLLVPDEVVTAIVEQFLSSPPYLQGCILDGFPRTLPQAQALDAFLQRQGRAVDAVVNIMVAEDEIIRRLLLRGRPDDSEAVIRQRLQVYAEQTQPVLDYYAQQGKLRSVDGNADIETVHHRIVQLLRSISVDNVPSSQ